MQVLDTNTLAFADFAGNAQYISVGNLDENNKAFIFLMDYVNRRRIKLWGTAEYVEDDQGLLAELSHDDYGGRVERAIKFHLQAWDVNCPQHITRRFSEDDQAGVELACSRFVARLSALDAAKPGFI